MQNSTWKLVALAGVVGIGLLVLLQVQRGLSRRDVVIDEQATEEDRQRGLSDEPTASLGLGVADSRLGTSEEAPAPASQNSSAGEFSSEPSSSGDLAFGQSEPRTEAGHTSRSSRPAANPFAAETKTAHAPITLTAGQQVAASERQGGLDFRDRKLKPLLASAKSTNKNADTSKQRNPFAVLPTTTDSQKPTGPALVSPDRKNSPSRKKTLTLSPQPAAAFPDSKPAPAITSPTPAADAFNPFEPAPKEKSKTPAAKPLPSPGTSADLSRPGGKTISTKPAATKSIRILDKQPLPPKAIADGKSSSTTQTPQRLDVPKQAAPLQNDTADSPVADDSPAADGAIKSDTSPKPQLLKPQLKIKKIAPRNAILGQPMIYHILVKNVGRAEAHQVVVKDEIPKGSQLTGTIPRAYLTDRLLSWRLGTLKPNEIRRIAVRVVPQTAGEIGSIATVDFVSKVTPIVPTPKISAPKITTPKRSLPKLSVTVDAPSTVPLGESLQFHFKITNSGSSDAQGVFIRDVLPIELEHAIGRDLEYKIGTIPAGKTHDVRLTMKAVKAGKVTNRVVVTADGGLKTEAVAAVHITDRTKLTITRTGPRKRYVGQTALYTNHLTNRSDRPATGIRLVESVPLGMEVIKTTSGGRYDGKQRTITWTIDQLAAGQSQDLNATLRSLKTGVQESSVTVIAADGGRANVRSQTTVSGLASLRIEMPPISGPIDVGNPLAMRIVAANRGSAPATHVQIVLTVSEELAVVSVRAPVKNKATAAKIEFEPIESIAPGQEIVLDVILRSAKPGDARVSVKTQSDQMRRPLIRENAVQILADGQ